MFKIHINNPLNTELNPIRHLLALVGARHIVHVSGIRVKLYACCWLCHCMHPSSFMIPTVAAFMASSNWYLGFGLQQCYTLTPMQPCKKKSDRLKSETMWAKPPLRLSTSIFLNNFCSKSLLPFCQNVEMLHYGVGMSMWSNRHNYFTKKLLQRAMVNHPSAKCIAWYSTSHINPLKTKRRLLYLKTQFVPRSKHFSSQL